MSTQITRVPIGLQSILGTQAQGQNPSELAQVVAPVVDLTSFYAFRNEKWEIKASGQFTSNTSWNVEVPDGKVWIIQGIGWWHSTASTFVGDSYLAGCYLTNNYNSSKPSDRCPLTRPYKYEIIAGGPNAYDYQVVNDIVVEANGRIQFDASNVVSGGSGIFDSSVAIRYKEFDN